MLYIIGLLGGFGIITFFLQSVITKLGSNKDKTVLNEFLSPVLQGLEKEMSSKTSELFGQAQSKVLSKMDGMPDGFKEIVQEMMGNGFGSVQDVLKKNCPNLNLDNDEAVITITNDRLQPFQLSGPMIRECEKIIEGKTDDYSKARAIFDWFERNITYDHVSLKRARGYRNARQVFEEKKGICGEMAFLFVVMAWYSGINSASYVSVRVDCFGKKVHHACASFFHKNKLILVDPAYSTFDVKHKKYEVADNDEIVRIFKTWN